MLTVLQIPLRHPNCTLHGLITVSDENLAAEKFAAYCCGQQALNGPFWLRAMYLMMSNHCPRKVDINRPTRWYRHHRIIRILHQSVHCDSRGGCHLAVTILWVCSEPTSGSWWCDRKKLQSGLRRALKLTCGAAIFGVPMTPISIWQCTVPKTRLIQKRKFWACCNMAVTHALAQLQDQLS